jgi:copper resistance protein B
MSAAIRLACALALVCAHAAQAQHVHGHSHEHGHAAPQTQEARPEADHSPMDHSVHHGHAAPERPQPARKTPSEAERAAAFPDLGNLSMRDHGMDDDAVHAFLKADEFGWREGHGASAFAWDIDGWIGRDLSRLRFRSEGRREAGRTSESSVELLYSRAISPWWDMVAGVRNEFRPGPSRQYAAIGVQGLAPYKFDVSATAYIGESGHAMLRASGEYELLFTDRLILTPELGFTLHRKDDPSRGVESGETGLHAGIRLRYEIRREIAPYIGHEWENHGGGRWIAGVRFWF